MVDFMSSYLVVWYVLRVQKSGGYCGVISN